MRPVASAAPNVRVWDGTNTVGVVAATATQDETATEYLMGISAIYAWDGSDLSRLLAHDSTNPNLRVQQYGGATAVDVVASAADGLSGAQGAAVSTGFNYALSGTTWDRERGNLEATVMASSSRAASANSGDQTNHNNSGCLIGLNISARTVGGSPLVTFQCSHKSSLAPNYDIYFKTGQFDPTVGFRDFAVYPGADDTDSRFVTVSGMPLSRIFRVTMIYVADVTALTYSVTVNLIR